jgi:cysteine desulfurase
MVARLVDGLLARQVRFSTITGDQAVLPGSIALRLAGIDAESLCMALGQTLCISTGSACTHGQLRMSHVLESMGLSEVEAGEVIRIFCPRTTGAPMIDRAIDLIAAATQRSEMATGRPRQ